MSFVSKEEFTSVIQHNIESYINILINKKCSAAGFSVVKETAYNIEYYYLIRHDAAALIAQYFEEEKKIVTYKQFLKMNLKIEIKEFDDLEGTISQIYNKIIKRLNIS